MELKTKIIDDIIKAEGGYVHHPNDFGKITNWGITQAVAHANGFTGDMRNLPRSLAVQIYENKYLKPINFDALAEISVMIAAEVADTGVNMGPATAARFLQQALNALNRNQKDYSDILEDAQIGPATIQALNSFVSKRGKEYAVVTLLKVLNILQGAKYIELARANKTQEDFMHGWLKRA